MFTKLTVLLQCLTGNNTTKDVTAQNTPTLGDNSKKLATTEFLLSEFTHPTRRSLASNGYQKFPGGLIIQWGQQAAVPSGGAVNITFPIPFPTTLLNVGATIKNTTGIGTAMAAGVGSESNSGMSLFHNGANAPTAITWYAIGF